MLLLGFGAALRRSDIVALTIDDVTVVDGRGLTVLVRREKPTSRAAGARSRSGPITATRISVHSPPSRLGWGFGAPHPTAPRRRPPPLLPPSAAPDPESCLAGERLPFCGITSSDTLMGAPMSDKIVARLVKQACALTGVDPSRFSGRRAVAQWRKGTPAPRRHCSWPANQRRGVLAPEGRSTLALRR